MLPNNSGHGWFVSSKELQNLRQREYHYNAWSNSILDPYMQPFWRFIVEKIPTYISPSTLSLSGLICNLVAVGITIHYAPTLTEPLPGWVCWINAVSIFLYQTFDGLDGKQCFRTQDSELEEYADHAVDSISITLNAILLCAALQLGHSPVALGINLVLAVSAFFAAHWAAQRTNSLVFGPVDVTEAQWSMIIIHVISGLAGCTIWDAVIFKNPFLTARKLLCIASACTLSFSILQNVTVIAGIRATPFEANGIRIPRTPFSYQPLLAYTVVITGSILCIKQGLLFITPIPTLLVIGLALGNSAARLILARLLKLPKASNLSLGSFSPYGLLFLSWLYNDQHNILRPSIWFIAMVSIGETIWLHSRAMADLKRIRDLYIFSVRPRAEKAVSRGFYVAGDNLADVQRRWKRFEDDPARVKSLYNF